VVSGGGVRQGVADPKSVPLNKDETPTTAADIRALAEQAEAEAAEAEALAAAARARARAIQLRRRAELAGANQQATEEAVAAEGKAGAADSVETQAQNTRQIEPEASESEDATENVQPEEGSDDAAGESDVDTSSADDVAEKPARRWLRRPKWSTLAAALAIIAILAALSGSGYIVKKDRDAVQQRQRAAEFAAAARQAVVALTSLDFNNAKQGVQRILDDATGSFKDDFTKTADDFVKVVEQAKVVEQGTVQALAVDLDKMTNDSAEVLVVSTSEVTNAAGAKQDPRSYRLIVTITRDGDQLKMSKVEFVP
jgi:Mce-associated membrane protein